jgi:Coenzyme PQQ synthesis protein D (PqqD)
MDPVSRGGGPQSNLIDERLLNQRPVRLYDYEDRPGAEDCIRVVIPRFGDSPFGRFMSRIAVQQEDKLNLDHFGSFVYRACDGRTSVSEIGSALKTRFGESVEPVDGRLVLFIKDLFRRNLISFVRDV